MFNQYATNSMGMNPYLNMNTNMNMIYPGGRQELVRVNGIEGAKAYQMQANSQVALFDENNDMFYIKFTDGAGFPTIRTFKFEELQNLGKNQENNVQVEQYVTRKDMEEYVKQYIQQSTAETNNAKCKSATVGND